MNWSALISVIVHQHFSAKTWQQEIDSILNDDVSIIYLELRLNFRDQIKVEIEPYGTHLVCLGSGGPTPQRCNVNRHAVMSSIRDGGIRCCAMRELHCAFQGPKYDEAKLSFL